MLGYFDVIIMGYVGMSYILMGCSFVQVGQSCRGGGWGRRNGLWVLVRVALQPARAGNPGRPPRRGTKQTQPLRGLISVAQWWLVAELKRLFHFGVQAACRNRGAGIWLTS